MADINNIIKNSMRISHDKLDDEIIRKIYSCKEDLKSYGVNSEKESELITTACEFYCKWHFNYMGIGSEFKKYYEDLRDHLSLSTEYRIKKESNNAGEE
jgi:hypothetical protein